MPFQQSPEIDKPIHDEMQLIGCRLRFGFDHEKPLAIGTDIVVRRPPKKCGRLGQLSPQVNVKRVMRRPDTYGMAFDSLIL